MRLVQSTVFGKRETLCRARNMWDAGILRVRYISALFIGVSTLYLRAVPIKHTQLRFSPIGGADKYIYLSKVYNIRMYIRMYAYLCRYTYVYD